MENITNCTVADYYYMNEIEKLNTEVARLKLLLYAAESENERLNDLIDAITLMKDQ